MTLRHEERGDLDRDEAEHDDAHRQREHAQIDRRTHGRRFAPTEKLQGQHDSDGDECGHCGATGASVDCESETTALLFKTQYGTLGFPP